MSEPAGHNLHEYVTAVIGGQLFGLPILRVQDVFVTRTVDASAAGAGRNCRSAQSAWTDRDLDRYALPTWVGKSRAAWSGHGGGRRVARRIYGLLIDSIGEVLKLDDMACEPNPSNLDPRLASVSTGIYRLDGQLLMILDVDRVLDIEVKAAAA